MSVTVPESVLRDALARALDTSPDDPLSRVLELIEEAGYVIVSRAQMVRLREAAADVLRVTV